MIKNTKQDKKDITRKEALGKIGNYGKYAALTAIGTYILLNPKKAQASMLGYLGFVRKDEADVMWFTLHNRQQQNLDLSSRFSCRL